MLTKGSKRDFHEKLVLAGASSWSRRIRGLVLCPLSFQAKQMGPENFPGKSGAYLSKGCKQNCRAQFVFQGILGPGQKFEQSSKKKQADLKSIQWKHLLFAFSYPRGQNVSIQSCPGKVILNSNDSCFMDYGLLRNYGFCKVTHTRRYTSLR